MIVLASVAVSLRCFFRFSFHLLLVFLCVVLHYIHTRHPTVVLLVLLVLPHRVPIHQVCESRFQLPEFEEVKRAGLPCTRSRDRFDFILDCLRGETLKPLLYVVDHIFLIHWFEFCLPESTAQASECGVGQFRDPRRLLCRWVPFFKGHCLCLCLCRYQSALLCVWRALPADLAEPPLACIAPRGCRAVHPLVGSQTLLRNRLLGLGARLTVAPLRGAHPFL